MTTTSVMQNLNSVIQESADTDTPAQEGGNTPAQEGGMRTRSRSATPPLPIVINSISSLRRSSREGKTEVCYYPEDLTHMNSNTSEYRSLILSNKKTSATCVAIAPSTIHGAG